MARRLPFLSVGDSNEGHLFLFCCKRPLQRKYSSSESVCMTTVPRSSVPTVLTPFDEPAPVLDDAEELAPMPDNESGKGTGLRPPVLIRPITTFRFRS